MNKQFTLLALLIGASLQAQAAQDPFFTITEDSAGSASKGYEGPWAIGISKQGDALLTLHTDNDAGSYFSRAPFANFLVDRFNFEPGCLLASSVCNSYWDDQVHRTYQWRIDNLNGGSQRENTGAFSGDENDGIVTALGDTSDDYVGYKMATAPYKSDGYYHVRTAFASVAGNQVDLNAKFTLTNDSGSAVNSLSLPNSMTKLDDRYIVAGTVAVTAGSDSSFKNCYGGNSDKSGHFTYCPGFDTQAAFWVLDSSGNNPQLTVAPSYYRADNSVLETAAATGLAEYNGKLYGVGYSSTGEAGSSTLSGRNVAVYWDLTLSGNTLSFGSLSKVPLALGEPGRGDKKMRHSWAIGVNSAGYVVGNQLYTTNKNRNRPTEMFVYKIGQSGNAVIPFENAPAEGANSQAAAINDHSMVVGWRDARNYTSPVVSGTNRLQEAFLYNAASGSAWYLNDLICGKSDSGSKNCAVQSSGKYYHITYANGISADGSIAATAYRYDNETDLNKKQNGVVVSIKMSPAVADFTSIDSKYVVSNPPVVQTAAEESESGGGGGSLFWLTLLAAPFAWWRRRH